MSNKLKHSYQTIRGNDEELIILVDNSERAIQYYDQGIEVPQGEIPEEDFHPITIYVQEAATATANDLMIVSRPTDMIISNDPSARLASIFLVYVDELGNETDSSKRERRNTAVKVTSGTKFEIDQTDQ